MAVGERELDGYKTVRAWASLRCPRRDHCDPSRRCEGFTPENRLLIVDIENRLFVAGFYKEKNS